jgi:hypothetical protein
MEYVDVLEPPRFDPTGKRKRVLQAVRDEDWLGTFNLWIAQSLPQPALLYQLRPDRGWAPNLLDVSSGGYYKAGESLTDGLREVEEELGRTFQPSDVTHVGRRLNVSYDDKHRERRSVVDIFMMIDNAPLTEYRLSEEEVPALFTCPVDSLLKLYDNDGSTFEATGISCRGEPLTRTVSRDSFPYNWDGYHEKIARMAQALVRGDEPVRY